MPTFPAQLPAADFSFQPALTGPQADLPFPALPSSVDLGQDLDFLADLNPQLTLLGGWANLAQAILHRLSTPRGTLFYDLNYGYDIRSMLNEGLTPKSVRSMREDIRLELLKDERIKDAAVAVQFNQQLQALGVDITVTTAAGPFALAVAVTAVTVNLLAANPAH